MNEVVNEVIKYSKLGRPRPTVKNTSPSEIAAPSSSNCIAVSTEQ